MEQRWRPMTWAAVGAVLGLAVGAGIHVALASVLEDAGGAVEELQGFVWNLVPLGTVGGAVLGWALWRRRGGDG